MQCTSNPRCILHSAPKASKSAIGTRPPQSSQPSCLRFTATSLDDIGWSPPDWSSALLSAWLVKFRTVNDLDVCVGSCQPLGLALGVGTFLVIGSDPIHTNFWGLCLSSICISFGIACFLESGSSIGCPATCVVRSFLLFPSIRA